MNSLHSFKLFFVGMRPDLVLTADQKVVHFRKHLKRINKLDKVKERTTSTKSSVIFSNKQNNEQSMTCSKITQLPQSVSFQNISRNIENSPGYPKLVYGNSNEDQAASYYPITRNAQYTKQMANETLVSATTNTPIYHNENAKTTEQTILVNKRSEQPTNIPNRQYEANYSQRTTSVTTLQPNAQLSGSNVIGHDLCSVQGIASEKMASQQGIQNNPTNAGRKVIPHQSNEHKHHQEYWNLGHKCRLQQMKHLKRQKLEKINEVIESFVPTMRTTNNRKEFIIKIINMHKDVSDETIESGSSDDIRVLNYSTKRPRLDREEPGSILTTVDLLNHFHSLSESFVKFAKTNEAFKCLKDRDKSELLKRNSQLFVMVSGDEEWCYFVILIIKIFH